jgi:hypothetical protein
LAKRGSKLRKNQIIVVVLSNPTIDVGAVCMYSERRIIFGN